MLVKKPKHITELELRTLAAKAKGKVNRIYLHWTAGSYGQPDDDYHLCVDRLGQVYRCCKDLSEKKAHTWMRNQGGVAIALCCGENATCWLPVGCNPRMLAAGVDENLQNAAPNCAKVNFGSTPPTQPQIEKMAKLAALLCDELELAVSKDTVMTHCEVAFKDGYGPGSGDPDCCWDLWFLPDAKHFGRLLPGGEMIRGQALALQQSLHGESKN